MRAEPMDLRQRTKEFALRIVRLSSALPTNRVGDILGRQILKSGTSVGANWREACRASSSKHFVSLGEICLREAEETRYWLEIIAESEIIKSELLDPIADECSQLIAILTTIIKNAKRKNQL